MQASLLREPPRAGWSFLAGLPALILLLGVQLILWRHDGWPVQPRHAVLQAVLVDVVSWLGFAVVSHAVAWRFGLLSRWRGYIAGWNWCSVPQVTLQLLGVLPILFDAPGLLGHWAALASWGWAVWLEYAVTRLALDVPGPGAAGLVALDLCLGLFLQGIAGSLPR